MYVVAAKPNVLWDAVDTGNLEEVKKVLLSGVDINAYNYERLLNYHDNNHKSTLPHSTKTTAIALASHKGYFQIVKYLLESGANPYIPYKIKQTPLYLATIAKHETVAEYIRNEMKCTLRLNKIEQDGYTPLTYCIKNQHYTRAKELIALGADPFKFDKHGKTPLIYAIDQNSLEIVKLLLKNNAATWTTALKHSMDLSRNNITEFLLTSNNLLYNCILSDGCTPLTRGLNEVNFPIVKHLIENGANPRQIDKNNQVPLNLAFELNSLEVVELLVSKGAEIPRELDGTILQKNIDKYSLDLYSFLIKNNWNINQIFEDGKSLLAHYASQRNFTFTAFFVENGADVTKAKKELDDFCKSNADFNFFMTTRKFDKVTLDVQEGAQE